jgi:serine/threonine-protein kinase HipA
LVPPGEDPGDTQKIEARPLSDNEVEEALIHATASTPLRGMDDDDFRISIAGAQEKSAFLMHEGKWCKPLGATPTTHIFKLPLGLIGGRRRNWSYSVENEWLCSKIIDAYGVPIAKCDIRQFGSQRVLIVERFDRQRDPSGRFWRRLVQEDFCQALGLASTKKYEEDAGPGILDLAAILRGSVNRDGDLANLLRAQILFWMLAACDGHAKNFSIRILSQGRYHLTPLYDVLSYWPVTGEGGDKISPHKLKLAMAFRGKNKHASLLNIQRRHLNETAARSGFGESAEPLIEEILGKTPNALAAVEKDVPKGFPQEVIEPIVTGVLSFAKRLEAMVP